MSTYKKYTSVEIYNYALARIGLTSFITLFSDPSVEAMIGKVSYQHTLEKVLEEFPWPFATKFLALTEYVPPVTTSASIQWHIDWWGSVGQTDATLAPKVLPDGWGYVYSYPSDCLMPRSIWSGAFPVNSDARIPFRVVDNGMSLYDTVIFTNMDDAILEYTYIPSGYEDSTKGQSGNGDLTDDAAYFDDVTPADYDDGTSSQFDA